MDGDHVIPPSEESKPRILSEEEIELYLRGDRREIDRLILLSINRIAATLIPHAVRENKLSEQLEAIGGMEGIAERARFVDAMIERQKARNQAMWKVAQSGVAWALPILIGFVAMAVWNAIKQKVGG